MKINFAYQFTNRKDEDIEKFIDACKKIGIEPILYGLIADELEMTNSEEFQKNEFVIPFGTTKMLHLYNCSGMPENTLVFYDNMMFDQDSYRFHLKDLLLNYHAFYLPYEQIKHTTFDYPVFMKPSSDLKAFDGCIVEAGDTLERTISNGRRSKYLTDETLVLFSVEKQIEKEFRCFVVDGKIIDISSYKSDDVVQWKHPTIEERQKCEDFFQQVSSKYRPDDCYVVDFCLSDGTMKVVEYNCIHCSGFYTCDIAKILSAMVTFIEKETS